MGFSLGFSAACKVVPFQNRTDTTRCQLERLTKRDSGEGIDDMEIKRSGSQPSGKGPADWFTGTVRIDPLVSAPAPARVVGASVTFEPGARTAWQYGIRWVRRLLLPPRWWMRVM